ncbi:glycosyltransferase, partial [Desulfovibrio desulfuricans]|nr:glycosyltransferase [Desulfovibrio desulfuricans]
MGLRAAQSPYVYFLDSDDYVLRDTFAEYMDAMGNADVDIAYGVIDHTWFKRSNYLSQIEDKEADLAEKE